MKWKIPTFVFALVAAALFCVQPGHADGLPKSSKIAAPIFSPDTTVTWKPAQIYAGALGSHTWATDDAKSWQATGVIGMLWRGALTGPAFGVEVDYSLADLDHVDDGASFGTVRARFGYFVTGKTFIYGAAGLKWATDAIDEDARKGSVYALGVEQDIGSGLALRLEWQHERESDIWGDWGEHGRNSARAGVVWKF